MSTNVELNDQLVDEAMRLGNISTKRELIDQALTEFVANRKRLDLRDLRGVGDLRDDYDYKASR